jgi:quercetin dioxygenase-like cupin family protein
MLERSTWLVLFGAAIVVAALHYAGNGWATPADKFTSTALYKGTFGDIDVFNHFVPPNPTPDPNDDDEHWKNTWLSWQKTKGSSDLFIQQNDWGLKGTTGWHTHPGHSLIIVTAGTVTVYEGHDPDCKPHVYTKGMTFVDPGGEHVHIIRNEGSVDAQTIAVQLIPAGQPRRIEVPDPGNCHF